MKKLINIAVCLILIAAAQYVYGQNGNGDQTAGPRDLYNTYNKSDSSPSTATPAGNITSGKPGVRVRVELDRDNRVRWVSSKTVFKSGDKVRFHFAMNFPGYVVVINQGSSGSSSLLFPYAGVSNHIGRTADYTLPQGEAWFEFDNTPGSEQLTFIMSKREIQEVTQITTVTPPVVNNSPPPANQGSSNQSSISNPPASATTAAVKQTEEQEILAALNARSLDRGRDLKLVEDKNENYVLTTDEALAKPVGFKLTLKHQ